jgi:hypothetical protein
MPQGWSTWVLWPYTDKKVLSGIGGGVDCSQFNGTQAALEHLVGVSSGPPPTAVAAEAPAPASASGWKR